MVDTIKAIYKHRRKTASQWTSDDTILLEGEIGIETDTNKIKIGDGVLGWTDLPYFETTVSKGYKEYVGVLSYETTPETVNMTVISTDLGTITVTHPSTNIFLFTSSGKFTSEKTIMLCGNLTNYFAKSYRSNANECVISLTKHDGTTNSIEVFSNLSVIIRVYD